MNRCFKSLVISMLSISLSTTLVSYAGEWKRNDIGWWYEYEESSYPTSTWDSIDGSWYYFDEDGYMATNRWIGNYYLGSSGAMLTDTTTPDGYQVGTDGAWISSSATSSSDVSTWNAYNVDAYYAIEADVSVSGTGGAVAKLVILGPSSAIAFDIVTDSTSAGTYFYRENIHSNEAGGQEYMQFPTAGPGKTYHLMVAFRKDGCGMVFLDGELLETFWNEELANSSAFMVAVEAGARENGSTVSAVFSDITIKKGNKISSSDWNTVNRDNNAGLHSDTSTFSSDGTIKISGTLELEEGEDWDTAYNGSSGIIHFM